MRKYKSPTPLSTKANFQLTKKFILFIFFALIAAGCSPITKREQPAHSDWIELEYSTTIGQTFLARYDGLQNIDIYLKSDQDPNTDLHLTLFGEDQDQEIITTSQISLADIDNQGYYSFNFPTLIDTTQKDYYFTVESVGPGKTWIGTAPGNTYLNGSLYVNEQPRNSQISFRLGYSQISYLSGIAYEFVTWFGVLAVVLALTALPGWGALTWLFPPWRDMNWVARLSLSIGIGMAFLPILFLWSDAFGIQPGFWGAWLLPLSGLASIIIRKARDWREGQSVRLDDNPPEEDSNNISNKAKQWDWSSAAKSSIPELALVIVMGVIIFTRFWPVRLLDAPMWGDSYHHTLISQLMVENGGLFSSWSPYTPLSSFTYHFGFHTLVAEYHWLTGEGTIQATLWIGQALNIFAIFALYPLAILVGKNKWAGVFAILIAGLISPMPMSYVNWGRYTQLAGQVILPSLILLIWLNLKTELKNWKWISLIWLTISGLSLTHYRVVIFIPLFYLAFIILSFRKYGFLFLIKRSFLQVAGAMILISPWILRLSDGRLPTIYGQQIATAASQVAQSIQQYNAIGDISGYLPNLIWVLMILSIVWGIWRRNQESNIFSLWWFLILFAANPGWLRLPGTGILSNFAIFIAAYIPAGILIGAALADLLSELGIVQQNDLLEDKSALKGTNSQNKELIGNFIIIITVIAISILTIRPNLRIVQPAKHALVTRPDLKASDWITENLPANAKFLVNSFFAYSDTLVVGSDAGWWLPLIAGRETTLPPINYGTEQGPPPDFVSFTNDLVALIKDKGVHHSEVLNELRNRGVTHIFIGQQQGQVNSGGPAYINAKELASDPHFKLVYNQDRVFIFELIGLEG